MKYSADISSFFRRSPVWILSKYCNKAGAWENAKARALYDKMSSLIAGPSSSLVRDGKIRPEIYDLFNILEIHDESPPEVGVIYVTENNYIGAYAGQSGNYYKFSYGNQQYTSPISKKIYPLTCPREAELFGE